MKVEVLLARMACGGAQASRSRKSVRLTSRSSETASMTRSASATAARRSVPMVIRAGSRGRILERDAADLDKTRQTIGDAVSRSLQLRLVPVVQLRR